MYTGTHCVINHPINNAPFTFVFIKVRKKYIKENKLLVSYTK